MISLKVDKAGLKRLQNSVRDKILIPKLQEINADIQKTIASNAKKFKGVSSPSLSSVFATKAKLNRKNMKSKIVPQENKALAFWMNRTGYDQIQLVDVTKNSGLSSWVGAKYKGSDKEAILAGNKKLRIRSKDFRDALGSADRDFFGLAFENIVKNPKKFGLN